MNKAEDQIKTRQKLITSGVLWSAANLVVTRGVSISTRLFLAHLLVPEAFGVIAMIVVVLGFINVFVDLGVKNALIQRPKDYKSDDLYNSAFWFLISIGLILTIGFILIGIPLIIHFTGELEIKKLGYIMGWSVFFHSLSIIPRVILLKEMKFNHLISAEIIAVLLSSALAIIFAKIGFGIWSLAIQHICLYIFRAFGFSYFTKWVPPLKFSWAELKQIQTFSTYFFGVKLTQHLRAHSDTFLVGIILNATALGLYNMAYLLTEVVRSAVATIVNRILLPLFSKVQNSETEIAKIFHDSTKNMTLLIFPISLSIFIHTDDIIHVLFNEEWYSMISAVKVLAVSGFIYSAGGPAIELFQGSGHPKSLFSLLYTNYLLVSLPLFVFLTYKYDIIGTSYAVVLGMLTLRIRMQILINRLFPLIKKSIIKALMPGLISVILCIVLYKLFLFKVDFRYSILLYFLIFYGQIIFAFRETILKTVFLNNSFLNS